MTDQALICLDLMEFDGKDAVMQKVSQIHFSMFEKCMQYMQLALMLAQKAAPEYVNVIGQDMMNMGGQAGAMPGGAPNMAGIEDIAGEPANVAKARAKSANASQPNGGAR